MVKYGLASFDFFSSVLKDTISKAINPAAGVGAILLLYGMLVVLIYNVSTDHEEAVVDEHR